MVEPRHSAVKMRRFFQIASKLETTEKATADMLQIRCHMNGSQVTKVFLAYMKDGEVVAMAPISRSDFKRLKSDFEWLSGPAKSRSAMNIHNEIYG